MSPHRNKSKPQTVTEWGWARIAKIRVYRALAGKVSRVALL